MKHILRTTIFTIFIFTALGCSKSIFSRSTLIERENAMRSVAAIEITDDLDLNTLKLAINMSILNLETKSSDKTLVFGDLTLPISTYRTALKELVTFLESNPDNNYISKYISSKFEFREVYGHKSWGQALITSYFEPIIKGSLKPTKEFTRPLYKLPSDLMHLDLSDFDPKWSDQRKLRARIESNKIVPYYSREEIDSKGALNGRSLELCWVDPIDAFFLHIQGSGTIKLDNAKELRLNFADKNGHPYRALGNYLKEIIPLSEMNLTNMQSYLHTLDTVKLHNYLNMNPSYVFFTTSEINAVTASGAPATAGRTIATDARFFPKNSLVLIEFEKPIKIINTDGEVSYQKEKIKRLVMDQDTGGAITGGGRIDLFWGRGHEAGDLAGRVNSHGRAWYLVPK